MFWMFTILPIFFEHVLNLKVKTVSMFHFLKTDIREQKKYKMKTQTSVGNTVNDLCYQIKFENCVKDKNNFFIKRNIAFLS